MIIIDLILSILIGVYAGNKGRNGFGYFFIIFILSGGLGITPLILMMNNPLYMGPTSDILYNGVQAMVLIVGFIIALVSKPIKTEKEKVIANHENDMDKLRDLKLMFEEGFITKEEFEEKKKGLFNVKEKSVNIEGLPYGTKQVTIENVSTKLKETVSVNTFKEKIETYGSDNYKIISYSKL